MVWNEKEGCKIDTPLLPYDHFYEVYAVDGGSTDGTVELLTSQGVQVYKQPVKSLNAAYHYAVELCKGDAVVVFFPKGTITPMCVLDIANKINGKIDFVVASRNMRGGKNEEDDQFFKLRKWGVLLLAEFTSLIWRREGGKITDILHGVKGFTLNSFEKMSISKVGVTVDLEMAVRSYRFNIERDEIPVVENCRVAGETHFKILPTAKKLGKFLLSELRATLFGR